MEDKVIVVEDWAPPPNPSPGAFVTSFLNDEFGSRSFSDLLAESGNELPFMGSDGNTIQSYGEENQFSSSLSFGAGAGGTRLFNDQKSSSRGGLSERRAVTAPKINTSRTRSADMSPSSPEIRSPYLTIPAGLSPTTLLDSPVFLSNSMAQPSPTTGKLLFGQGNNNNSTPEVPDASRVLDFEGFAPEAFAFKSHLGPGSYFSSTESKAQLITDSSVLATTDNQQPLSVTKMSVQSEYPVSFQNQQDFSFRSGFSDSSERNAAADDISLIEKVSSDSYTGNENSPPLDNQQDGEADTKGEFSSVTAGAPADDGYNWRKYGQKQVKGSEYPRSYYKCTNLNCQVKKKVERSLEGHITEIVYKGVHNHPKPLPNRRSAVASSPPLNEMQYDGSEHTGSLGSFEAKPFLGSTQNGHDWKNDGLEASSAAAATEFCDPTASVQSQDGSRFETPDTIDVSSTVSNEDEEDRATHGSISQGGDGEGDEMESKRRKIDTYAIDMSVASRAIREPRVVVQTTSEVDILDDGYRWRKYGQKVVKGNPNPRSYYKCTHPGCTVRKHVERASNDLKSVITTYEGKHNHEVPAARNSGNHASSLSSITSGTSTTSLAHPFHRRAELTQESLMRFGVRPPLSSFGFPGRETMGPSANFGFGMPHQGLRGPVVTGMNSVTQMKMPVLPPVRSFAGHRQTNEMGFATTKGEIKEEPMPDSRLPTLNGATIYHQMMGRLPLGPQL